MERLNVSLLGRESIESGEAIFSEIKLDDD